jgi:glycosyltransferase involved in cell wall biosynthesis
MPVPDAQRPHVLMLMTTPWPFGKNWARAASRIARVTTLSRARRLRWAPLPELPYLARNPDDDNDFEILESPLRRLRPTRVFGGVAERHLNVRLSHVLRFLSARRGRIDCVHSHFAAIWDTEKACATVGIPLVHTEHSSTFVPEQPIHRKRLSRAGMRRARRLFSAASTVMFVSSFLREAVARRGLSGNFQVVPNPVDTARFRPTPFPGTDQGIRLLSIGRLAPEKEPELLLRAFALALETNGTLTLDILGGGPLEAEVKTLVQQLGIQKQVRFLGFVPNQDLPDLIARSHVFVTATRIETFGMAVAEALACGRPVVAPRVGALPDLVTSQRGVLVSPNDVHGFAGGILKACTLSAFDPMEIGAAAAAGWSDHVVAEALHSIYGRALGRSREAID